MRILLEVFAEKLLESERGVYIFFLTNNNVAYTMLQILQVIQ